MKYYDEESTGALRERFEGEVLHWPEVTTRLMFGCPSYQVKERLFAFLVTGGIVMTQLLQADRDALGRWRELEEFTAGERVMKKWVKVSVEGVRELSYLLPYVRKSYERAIARAEE